MIPALIIFFTVLTGKLIFDLILYNEGKANKHTAGPLIVFITLIVCSWLGGWWSVPMWFFGWWVLYDNLYGILIGQDIFYIGTTAKLDRLQRKYPVVVWIKYLCFLISLILFIWMQ